MDDVIKIYNEDKLLVRAMDLPLLRQKYDKLIYDCSIWANEFCYLMNGGLNSLSTTLIVPNVGVSTYKNIGFLINSDNCDCFHISKTDSSSRGSITNGDFYAKEADYNSLEELSVFIKNNNSKDLNEININANIDSVVGLYINKCDKVDRLIQMIYIIKKVLKDVTNNDYPIYLYDSDKGKIKKLDISYNEEMEIINNMTTSNVYYWPDNYAEPIEYDINDKIYKTK